MKRSICVAAMLLAAGLSGCGSTEKTAEQIAGKKYYYEKEGFGGSFSIELNADGSFLYYEGNLSSYIATGTWSVSKDTVTLKDQDYELVNHFRIDGDSLRFIAQDSTNFMNVKVQDGEAFNA